MHYLKDRGFTHAHAGDITPREVYEGRRVLLRNLAAGAAGVALAGWAGRDALAQVARPGKLAALPGARSAVAGALTMEKLTPYGDATSYNNFYEFGTDKSDPARAAGTLKTRPWTIAVEGEVKKPKVYDLDELLKLAPMEERIYRLRCVEGWSMVIPWVGYSLSELIKRVEPTGNAKYVEFVTLADPNRRCPLFARRVLTGPMSKDCAWTRPCTR
jgi:sulfoxide reductase catalytic subunit YedY